MTAGQTWRRSQREIREGKAPRRLVERRDLQAMHRSHRWPAAGYLARRLALAVSVVFLVIASTVVHARPNPMTMHGRPGRAAAQPVADFNNANVAASRQGERAFATE
jgi:hypothetical protein